MGTAARTSVPTHRYDVITGTAILSPDSRDCDFVRLPFQFAIITAAVSGKCRPLRFDTEQQLRRQALSQAMSHKTRSWLHLRHAWGTIMYLKHCVTVTIGDKYAYFGGNVFATGETGHG